MRCGDFGVGLSGFCRRCCDAIQCWRERRLCFGNQLRARHLRPSRRSQHYHDGYRGYLPSAHLGNPAPAGERLLLANGPLARGVPDRACRAAAHLRALRDHCPGMALRYRLFCRRVYCPRSTVLREVDRTGRLPGTCELDRVRLRSLSLYSKVRVTDLLHVRPSTAVFADRPTFSFSPS